MTNRVTYGDRAFSVHTSKLWNNIPCELKDIKDINKFKKELKTHLYKLAYIILFKIRLFKTVQF